MKVNTEATEVSLYVYVLSKPANRWADEEKDVQIFNWLFV